MSLCAGLLLAGTLQDPADFEFFEKKIRPVLVEHCYSCHARGAKKVKGGLLLDTREGLRKGGDTGPGVVPGKPDLSLLVKAVRYGHEELRMPPKGRLADGVVADLVRWVERGAADPREGGAPAAPAAGIDFAAGRAWWSFRPVGDPRPPRAGHPVDAFIDARLEAAGLHPLPEAGRAVLLRRATIDLTGLPPSPEEVGAFLKDDRPDSYERVIDRLLASPRYGERWGRHWLDLVRYADSNGVDEDVNYPNAWRYRDYVIRAFNADLPYDRFILDQVAGDLAGGGSDALIATGLYALGPKMLAEPDLEKMKMDIADEQLDVVTRTFLGLTVSCARCHDHKFDPVSQADYYALAGIFRSTELITDYSKRPAILYEAELPGAGAARAREDYECRVADLKARIAAAGKDEKLAKELKKLETEGPDVPRAMSVREIPPNDLAIHLRGSHLALAKEKTPRGVPRVFEDCLPAPVVDPRRSGREELARWLCDPAHPLTARVLVNRLWQGHFGDGLVRTSSNFGLKGETPSHPELLDWLARDFVRGGWSVKRMHRQILTSAAYRRSSGPATEADPENRLLARQNRRRLEAEALRDAILFVSGALDLAEGGTVKGFPEDHGYYRGGDELYREPRRTVYLPLPRQKTYELLALFDYSDTAVHLEKRPATTVAPQALFMMNNPLPRRQARALAERLLKEEGSDDARARRLWLVLYSRPATDDEAYLLQRWARKGEPAAAWTNLTHALMASNEFLFVD